MILNGCGPRPVPPVYLTIRLIFFKIVKVPLKSLKKGGCSMVTLNKCIYCGQSVTDAEWHEVCRREFFEDLLAQVQSALRQGKAQDLPQELNQKISGTPFKTTEEIREERKQALELEDKRRHREAKKRLYLDECDKKWEAEHPGN